MASYVELYDLGSNTDLRNRIAVAVVKKAQVLIDKATPTTNEINWADAALKDPRGKAGEIIHYVLSANSSATVAQITGASDSDVQSNVDAAVDKLVSGGLI